jgi:hypothetical protein
MKSSSSEISSLNGLKDCFLGYCIGCCPPTKSKSKVGITSNDWFLLYSLCRLLQFTSTTSRLSYNSNPTEASSSISYTQMLPSLNVTTPTFLNISTLYVWFFTICRITWDIELTPYHSPGCLPIRDSPSAVMAWMPRGASGMSWKSRIIAYLD